MTAPWLSRSLGVDGPPPPQPPAAAAPPPASSAAMRTVLVDGMARPYGQPYAASSGCTRNVLRARTESACPGCMDSETIGRVAATTVKSDARRVAPFAAAALALALGAVAE